MINAELYFLLNRLSSVGWFKKIAAVVKTKYIYFSTN